METVVIVGIIAGVGILFVNWILDEELRSWDKAYYRIENQMSYNHSWNAEKISHLERDTKELKEQIKQLRKEK